MTADHPIAAVASGSGAAAVALLRLSGRGSLALLAPCLGRPSLDWPARELKLCRVVDPDKPHEVLDEAMVVHFAGPRSYTGEDSAEIHCHGGPYVVQRLLALLYRRGFRPAEPGEFTRRAFLHGKLDLTAAEGIRELVEAQSHQQWIAARHLTSGRLRSAIEDLRQTLISALALLEAQIDFPDEGDTAHLQLADVRRRVSEVEAQIARLIGSYASGRVAARGLMVALFGAPNAGKSTLLNELLGKERAIVTPVAGTTRDYLEEACLVEGRLVRLVDMAGVRDDPDPIEAIGVETARRLAREADLVVFLAAADGTAAARTQIDAWIEELTPRAKLCVVTKTDLGEPSWADHSWAKLSCRTGAGLPAFRHTLAAAVDACLGDLGNEPAFVTSARQLAALESTRAALAAFHAADGRSAGEELLAFELQQAVKALRSVIGDVGSEDVLDQIFASFCIGK